MEPSGWLTFDVNAVADALEISVDDVQTYFTDGRRVSFLIERRAVEAMPGSELAPNEGAGFDLIDSEGGLLGGTKSNSRWNLFLPFVHGWIGKKFRRRWVSG